MPNSIVEDRLVNISRVEFRSRIDGGLYHVPSIRSGKYKEQNAYSKRRYIFGSITRYVNKTFQVGLTSRNTDNFGMREEAHVTHG